MSPAGESTRRKAAITLPAELMVWLSSSFPVGAFAYSHGLEYAAHHGLVTDRASLEAWLATLVARGSMRSDMILAAEAWRARTSDDHPRLSDCNDLALALQPSRERHLESVTQGQAFRAAIRDAWGDPLSLPPAGHDVDIAYPVAVGMAAAGRDISLDAVLLAYAVAFVGNLGSAAIRLSIVGQTDAQRIIAALMPALETAAMQASRSSIGDLGSAAFAADLASLAHETQETRLFRS